MLPLSKNMKSMLTNIGLLDPLDMHFSDPGDI